MEFGEKLKILREQKRLGVNQLALKSGVSASQISRFENGQRKDPTLETVRKLASALGVSISYFSEDIKNKVHVSGTLSTNNEIPILGRIVASNPEGAVQDYEGNIAIQDNVISKYGIDNLFALRVNGDSMNKVVIPGSIAIIHKTDEWKDGDICAVLINGDEATLKKVYKKSRAIRFEPESWNPNQKPWEYTEDMDIMVNILGVYVYSVSGL